MRFSAVFRALILSVLLCAGCGGGGDSAAFFQPATPANSVVIKSAGPATTLYGIGFTLRLPAGVTLATPGGGAVAAGVITPSGGAVGDDVFYSSYYDSAATPQTVKVSFAKSSGFPVGEFVTIATQIAPGTTLIPGNLVLTEFKAYDNLPNVAVDTAITGEVAAP